jgi:hypothetical protein
LLVSPAPADLSVLLDSGRLYLVTSSADSRTLPDLFALIDASCLLEASVGNPGGSAADNRSTQATESLEKAVTDYLDEAARTKTGLSVYTAELWRSDSKTAQGEIIRVKKLIGRMKAIDRTDSED